MANPKLLLLDEGSLGLAPVVVDEVFGFLERMSRDGTSLLVVDQFAARALAMASSAYVVRKGSIVYAGAAEELLDERLGDGL